MTHEIKLSTLEAMVLMNSLRLYNPQKPIEIEINEKLKAKINNVLTKDLAEKEDISDVGHGSSNGESFLMKRFMEKV